MNVPPPGVDDQDLVAHLDRGWGLAAEDIRFVPEGFGSYHWVVAAAPSERLFLTVDDLETKPWLGGDAESAFAGLQACFQTALLLREHAGLPFVLAPRRTADGTVIRRIAERYSLAVFPFVDGRAGRWGEPLSQAVAEELTGVLASLHGTAPLPNVEVPRRGWALPGRTDLESALAGLAHRWGSGPYGEPARALLAAHKVGVERWLARYDELAGAYAAEDPDLVLTHGEPHPGNLLKTDAGAYLIDWDTVAMAPRERDLWMLAGHPDALAQYAALTGRLPDARGLELYRLTWALQDLAAFVGVTRGPHKDDADTRKAWDGLNDYFLDDRQVYPWA